MTSAARFPSGTAGAFPDVIAITDPSLSDDEIVARAEVVLGSVPPASIGVQLRDKVRKGGAVAALAERLRGVCRKFGAPLYVNDRVDVAIAVGSEGVHLGGASIEVGDAKRLLGARSFVSIAAHAPEDAARAVTSGASAALVSPIFATPGKGAPAGTELIAATRARAPGLRLYALGGVAETSVSSCLAAGADGVAVIRALWHAEDPAAAATALVNAVRAAAVRR